MVFDLIYLIVLPRASYKTQHRATLQLIASGTASEQSGGGRRGSRSGGGARRTATGKRARAPGRIRAAVERRRSPEKSAPEGKSVFVLVVTACIEVVVLWLPFRRE